MGKHVILASELGLIVAKTDRPEERHPDTLPTLDPPEEPPPRTTPPGEADWQPCGPQTSALAGDTGQRAEDDGKTPGKPKQRNNFIAQIPFHCLVRY